MAVTAYAGALVATVAAQAAPGPNLLAVASVALGQGRAPAVAVAAGVASGVLVWVGACAAGVAALLAAEPGAAIALKLLGGAYLAWLGARALVAARRGARTTIRANAERLSLGAAWRRGLFVVLTNPKAALMWTAITGFLQASGLGTAAVLAFAPVGAATAFAIYGGYGLLFSGRVARGLYARGARGFEAGFGVVFTVFGGSLLLSGLRDGVRALRGA